MSNRNEKWCGLIAGVLLVFCLSLVPQLLSHDLPMTQSHNDPADLAADELLTLLQEHHTDGDFATLLTAINTATDKSLDSDDLIFTKRDVPLTYLGDLDDQLHVSIMAGPEGQRELNDQRSSTEILTIDVAVELKMDEGNSTGNPLMRQLGRQISDYIHFTDGDDDIRRRRHLTSIDAMCLREQIVARYDPAELLGSSTFLSLRRFQFEAIT